MTPEDRVVITQAVAQAVKSAVQVELGAYKVPKEQHYRDHEWVNELRKWHGTIKNTAISSVVKLVIAALGALVIYGFLLFKGGS